MSSPHHLVHAFDDPPDVDDATLKTLLGGKGAGLVIMTRTGLPVPPGFVLTTEMCRQYLRSGWDESFDADVRAGIDRLERTTGRCLGDERSPLLVSVRSGAAESMPGMMDTVLDVGTTPEVEAALAAETGNPDFAADTRRRGLLSFAAVVRGAPPEVLAQAARHDAPSDVAASLIAAGFGLPADPSEQVLAAVRSVFDSWRSSRAQRYREVEGIDEATGTAATVQAMVFGNRGIRSGTGVAFSRDPVTGARGLVGDFLVGAQGEDVVSGDHTTLPLAAMRDSWPEQFDALEQMAHRLEHLTADMVDIEFTVEDGRLWMLQFRRGKRSPIAAFRCAIDMADDPDFPVDRDEAVRRCRPYFDDPPLVPAADDLLGAVIASGLAASPGRATGQLCVDPDEAVRIHDAGGAVVLARRETSPADIHGIAASVGLFTLLGGLVSHAAVVARDWGLPAVVGATEARITDRGLEGPGGIVPVGGTVTVDGDRGTLTVGADGTEGAAAPAPVAPEVLVVQRWAADLDLDATPPPDATRPSGGDERFAILHALHVRGMVTTPGVVAMTGIDDVQVSTQLSSLVEEGLATHIEARGLWRLTDEGRGQHATELTAQTTPLDLDALPYDAFLHLNQQFKQLCTDWQLRDGELNDHSDPAYDASIVDRLGALDDAAGPVIEDIAAAVWWTKPYRSRLAAARRRVVAGEPKALTGVMCDSYHDIWMELHEDLIVTLGIDRSVEGST